MGVSSSGGYAAKTNGGPLPREIASLTALRGFLAIWVVAYHFWNDALRLFPQLEALSPIAWMGHMAVPAFFMLSGFVLSYNYAGRFRKLRQSEVSRFLCLRLARIYPVHLATLLAVAAMVWVSDLAGYHLTDAGYTARDFVLNLFLVHTWVPDFKLNWNYPSWSISSEWFAYLLFPFAVVGPLRWLATPSRAAFLGLVALASSVAVMACWRPWPFYELVLVIPTFFAGAAVCGIARNLLRGRAASWWRWLPELLALVLGASCFLPSTGVVTATLLCGFFLLIMALAKLSTDCHWWWSGRPAVFLGEVSYSLYMTHTLAQKILYRLVPSARFAGSDFMTRLGMTAGYIGLVGVCCLATYFLVENPCRRLFKKAIRYSNPENGRLASTVNKHTANREAAA